MRNLIIACVWLVWAGVIYAKAVREGREVGQMFYVALICSTVWTAA